VKIQNIQNHHLDHEPNTIKNLESTTLKNHRILRPFWVVFVGSDGFVAFVVLTLDFFPGSTFDPSLDPLGFFVPGATERMALTSRARDVVLKAWTSKQVKHGGSGFHTMLVSQKLASELTPTCNPQSYIWGKKNNSLYTKISTK